ncbi:MAG TPA: polysaccharide deacetylase family protein [Labilithrix sp.]|jgi:peptidoglycan/xylan/chitin deacetylase (PgdA/CDA1 family)|nr:polysaccharide deacetylase family protein [Labilithrix sp.]
MARATAIKLVAGVLVAVEAMCLRAEGRALAIVLTLLAMFAFFAHVIASPRSQFLVRSTHRLPTTETNAVAFTFDDGPDPATTPRVLELLAAHDARATFFVVGSRAAAHPDIVRRIVEEGHEVGSHTYRHSNAFHFMTPSAMRAEVERGIAAVAAVTGSAPRLFRPPQGLRTPFLRDALSPLEELVCVTWTARGLDTMGLSASAILRRLESEVCAGAILTLHDGAGLGGTSDRRPTIEALERLLEIARERGLRCVSLAALAGQA